MEVFQDSVRHWSQEWRKSDGQGLNPLGVVDAVAMRGKKRSKAELSYRSTL